ncbi:DEAD/DEAH box helicase [Aeromonas veronii]|uniref:DEAD/DEAH box helicase n=1 Tax=Aeromonas veronii TaxID=654 RepID=UPI00301E4B62
MLEQLINGESIEVDLQDAIKSIHNNGPINPATLEKLSFIKKYHNNIFTKYERKILSVMGLFYKLREPMSILEVVYQNLGDSISDKYGHQFTPIQARAYKSILNRKFYSFSAPTSTGKSYLFRELIKHFNNDIIIVVPSRALIAEFYTAVINLVEKDVLVLQFIENVNQHNARRRIFIITPERGVEIFKYANEFNIDLFLFDEAQISDDEIRGLRFDAFVRRTEREFPNSKKVFAHPFIENPEAQLKKHSFKNEATWDNFRQSNVGKIYATIENDGSFTYFSPYTETKEFPVGYDILEKTLNGGGTILIYISKSKIFSDGHTDSFGKYIAMCPTLNKKSAIGIIEKLKKYIGTSNTELGKQSSFIQLMERGVVVHHGSMPLKARLLIEEFVRSGHAKICFATSTLNQGINMPFDCVLIDNFRDMKELVLKNLIGRSGRSSNQPKFDYGYTIINRQNVSTFSNRLNKDVRIKEVSTLDESSEKIPDDYSDLVEAMKTNSFNDDLHLTQSQINRIEQADLKSDIEYVLERIIVGDVAITANQYYKIKNTERTKVKDKIKKIFCSHLKRPSLSKYEQSILSAAIPLLLWKIQGKSFSETLSLRHAYLTERESRSRLKRHLREKKISIEEYNKLLGDIKIKTSFRAESLPNIDLRFNELLFKRGTKVKEFSYDILVYDTYDYLDKVISLSLADPLCAAMTLYYEKTGDSRAKTFKNYLRYGTNDATEIWLLKYGFDPEDIEWISAYVTHIDENSIAFSDKIKDLTPEELSVIGRYIQ